MFFVLIVLEGCPVGASFFLGFVFWGARAGYALYVPHYISRFAQVGTGASSGRSVSPTKNGDVARSVPLLSLAHLYTFKSYRDDIGGKKTIVP
ncbi:MAG: hypothetical protein PF444_07855 [Bacteroidales bacterium]|nr:hypothetical protein [Bacteroidales bacterium]